MPVPNIDTFEHDVANEIKRKEASFTDIASASGNVGNAPETKKGRMLVPLLLGVLILLLVGAGGGYYLFIFNKPPAVAPVTTETEQQPSGPQIADLSQTLAAAVGPSIDSVEENEYGFSIKLREYTPVYAYMLRNESAYAEELASAVGSPRDTSTSTPPFTFADVTMSNQNMRVGSSASSTVVYAFVNSSYLVISSSTEGILSLRSAIIR